VQDGSRRWPARHDAGGADPHRRGLRPFAHFRGIADPCLLQRGEPVLMRAWVAGAVAIAVRARHVFAVAIAVRARHVSFGGVALLVSLVVLDSGAAHAAPVLVDTVLAEVGSAPVMLSDVSLARALGLLGLEPGPGPITDADLARYLDTQLAVREANQVGIEV